MERIYHNFKLWEDYEHGLYRKTCENEGIKILEAKELLSDADEILRLSQISGLAEMFADKEFSQAWEASGELINEEDDIDIMKEEEHDTTKRKSIPRLKAEGFKR